MVSISYKLHLGDILWIVGEEEALANLQEANNGNNK